MIATTKRVGTSRGGALIALVGALSLAACSGSDDDSTSDEPPTSNPDAPMTVWVDETRTAAANQFATEHPDLDVDVVTIPGDPGYILTQVNLANQGSGEYPDVVFLNTPEDVAYLAAEDFGDFAQPLNDLIEQDVLDGFAPGSLDGCTFDDQVYCTRNDIGQTVLWYNQKLMADFGYDVPETWADYVAIGEDVAESHPGYIVGALNGKWGAGTFFTSSGCPTRETVDLYTVKINTDDPRCQRVIDVLEPLLDNGTITTLAHNDPVLESDYGQQNKILMLPAASWYGDFRFGGGFGSPDGEIAAAPMPLWEGEDTPRSGSVGGGAFVVSRHAENMAAAVEFATWMTTDIDLQSAQPTYPAYEPAVEAWCEVKADRDPNDPEAFIYAEDPCPVMQEMAPLISETFGWIRYATQWNDEFNATIASPGRSGSLADAVAQWGERLRQAAEESGYEVVE